MDVYYPTLGIGQEKFEVAFNFGQDKFCFDILHYAGLIEKELNEDINNNLDYTQINETVLNYLMTNGYK